MAELWDPDIDFSDADARRLVESQFPQFTDASLTPFGQGWDNRLFLMNDEWVLRFPVRHIAAPLIAHELASLPLLEPRLPRPVPNPELAGEPDGDYPFRWMGYRRLAGEVLCRIESPPASHRMAAQLGEFLAVLHGADPAELDLPGDTHDKAVLPDRFGELRERVDRLAAAGTLRSEEAALILGQAQRLSAAPPWPHPPRPVHGDLYGYHILSDGREVTGVIDWGDIHLGDPALDLSVAFGWFDAETRPSLFAGYGPIDEATLARARFRALYYGPVLILYGRDIGDPAVEATGWRALRAAN